MIWLHRVNLKVQSESTRMPDATVSAWLPTTGQSEVKFDRPVEILEEGDLVLLLKACRVARKQYKVADSQNIME